MEVINMAATINKDMIIADMLKIDPGIAAILMASGMHCIGCPSAQGETLDEAAMVHGMNADELVVNVNEYLAKKEA
jgi:hybrid cluster-associated redox disulfide protein